MTHPYAAALERRRAAARRLPPLDDAGTTDPDLDTSTPSPFPCRDSWSPACAGACACLEVAALVAVGRRGCSRCGQAPVTTGTGAHA